MNACWKWIFNFIVFSGPFFFSHAHEHTQYVLISFIKPSKKKKWVVGNYYGLTMNDEGKSKIILLLSSFSRTHASNYSMKLNRCISNYLVVIFLIQTIFTCETINYIDWESEVKTCTIFIYIKGTKSRLSVNSNHFDFMKYIYINIQLTRFICFSSLKILTFLNLHHIRLFVSYFFPSLIIIIIIENN